MPRKRALTDKQSAFLQALFGPAKGDPKRAKKLAGYSDATEVMELLHSLQEEIKDYTRKYLDGHTARAAVSIVELLDDPTTLGGREKLAAAKDLLDRTGFKPTDKVEVQAESPLFILPPKGQS